jgi:hypothetical protein
MTPSFRVAVVGPSRVGKTTLLTAILSDTRSMLAGTPVSVSMDEPTHNRVRRQEKDLRRAIAVGEFDAASLGGTQGVSWYHVALHPDGDESVQTPFDLLDYPGAWLDPGERSRIPEAAEKWPVFLGHIRESIMLLVPIDAAVLMEANTPRQRGAAGDLLGLEDVAEVGLRWAKGRLANPSEPAVVVLAPLKCEKYFDDNGGQGHDQDLLRARVRETYESVLKTIAAETGERATPVRVVYAPIDTYGCVELMEAQWKIVPGEELPDFRAHYLFRGHPPRIRVRAAGTVMQELCRSVLAGQATVEADAQYRQQRTYTTGVTRQAEAKGFWGTIGYHLSGEASAVKGDIARSSTEMARIALRQRQLKEATERLASIAADPRVEVWSCAEWR